MDTTKLKSFLVLAECKSFSETADLLYLSQPAISKHIESLENELGVLLFNRNRGNTTLTIHGEYFLDYASEIVKLSEKSKEHLKQLDNLNEGTLHFGATNFIGVYLMPKLIAEYKSYYPTIGIDMTVAPSKKLFQKLEKHEIEFAFLSHYVNLDKNKYGSIPYEIDHMVLIVNKDHPLANKERCTLEDIAQYPFITKESTASLTRFISKKIPDKTINNHVFISNQESIKQAVIEGVGISIMSCKAVELEVKSGLIKTIEVEGTNLDREINIVYHKKFKLTPAGDAFFDILGIDFQAI